MPAGEPGTAESLLAELLAAAVGGTSTLTVQGGAATTSDQIKYSWNYALLVSEGPPPDRDVLEVLVGTFRELHGQQPSGERLSAVMSTAGPVSVAHAVGVRGRFLRGESGNAADLTGTAAKDSPEDPSRRRCFLEHQAAR